MMKFFLLSPFFSTFFFLLFSFYPFFWRRKWAWRWLLSFLPCLFSKSFIFSLDSSRLRVLPDYFTTLSSPDPNVSILFPGENKQRLSLRTAEDFLALTDCRLSSFICNTLILLLCLDILKYISRVLRFNILTFPFDCSKWPKRFAKACRR